MTVTSLAQHFSSFNGLMKSPDSSSNAESADPSGSEKLFLTSTQVVLMLQVLVCGQLSGKKGYGSVFDLVAGRFNSSDSNIVSAWSCEERMYSPIPETMI